jgi:hypothetical protein
MAVTISGTTGVAGNLTGNVIGNASTATLATNATNATTAVVAGSASNVVSASNLGLATCKAWVNFDGTTGDITNVTLGANNIFNCSAGSNTFTWASNGFTFAQLNGQSCSFGIASSNIFGGVDVNGSTMITGNGLQTATFRLPAGRVFLSTATATSNNTTAYQYRFNSFIRSSYNISSIFKNNAGDYTINFATPMTDANYCPVVTAGGYSSYPGAINLNQTAGSPGTIIPPTTSAFRFCTTLYNNSVAGTDQAYYSIQVFGN